MIIGGAAGGCAKAEFNRRWQWIPNIACGGRKLKKITFKNAGTVVWSYAVCRWIFG